MEAKYAKHYILSKVVDGSLTAIFIVAKPEDASGLL